ncbi:hypothetical protein GCM10009578_082010 [Streptomyces rhizosphaericus]
MAAPKAEIRVAAVECEMAWAIMQEILAAWKGLELAVCECSHAGDIARHSSLYQQEARHDIATMVRPRQCPPS